MQREAFEFLYTERKNAKQGGIFPHPFKLGYT